MIVIKDLTFAYGEKQIFSGFSTVFGDGITCAEGASGLGKTTLLRLIAGLARPDSGEISGVPEKVAFMFQEDRLMPWWTAEENVAAVLPKEKRGDALKWLEAVELGGEGLSKPGNLSGGQRRRVSLARALAYGGGLMILDEPFKGMDEPLAGRMAELIKQQGAPVIFTAHSQYELEIMGGDIVRL